MFDQGGGGGGARRPMDAFGRSPKSTTKGKPRPGQGRGYGVVAASAIPAALTRRSAPRPKSAPRSSGRSSGGGNSYRPPAVSYGGGGGGGNYGGGGGGVGSNRTGQISSYAPAPPPAPPAPPSLAAFSAKDSTYQSQLAALAKALTDYKAQQGQSKTQYLTSYAGDKDTLATNRTNALSDLENDYASRGLLQSGLYADSLSDTNTDYDKRGSALEQAKAAFLAQLTGDMTNFTSEQGLTRQKALQEAAARRAAKYNL